MRYTEGEVKALNMGVQRYGLGSWMKIVNDPEFMPAFRCDATRGRVVRVRDLVARSRREISRDDDTRPLLIFVSPFAARRD